METKMETKIDTKEAFEKDLIQQAKDLGYRGRSTRIPYLQKWIRSITKNKQKTIQDQKRKAEANFTNKQENTDGQNLGDNRRQKR